MTPDDVRSSAVIVSATSVVCRVSRKYFFNPAETPGRLARAARINVTCAWNGIPEMVCCHVAAESGPGGPGHRLVADVEALPAGRPLLGDGGVRNCCQSCARGCRFRARRHRALHRLVADDEALPIGRPLRGYGYISICCQSCACGSHHDHGLMRRKGAAGIAVTVVPTHLQNAPRCCEVFWAPCSWLPACGRTAGGPRVFPAAVWLLLSSCSAATFRG